MSEAVAKRTKHFWCGFRRMVAEEISVINVGNKFPSSSNMSGRLYGEQVFFLGARRETLHISVFLDFNNGGRALTNARAL